MHWIASASLTWKHWPHWSMLVEQYRSNMSTDCSHEDNSWACVDTFHLSLLHHPRMNLVFNASSGDFWSTILPELFDSYSLYCRHNVSPIHHPRSRHIASMVGSGINHGSNRIELNRFRQTILKLIIEIVGICIEQVSLGFTLPNDLRPDRNTLKVSMRESTKHGNPCGW